jgi:hypothetical protein
MHVYKKRRILNILYFIVFLFSYSTALFAVPSTSGTTRFTRTSTCGHGRSFLCFFFLYFPLDRHPLGASFLVKPPRKRTGTPARHMRIFASVLTNEAPHPTLPISLKRENTAGRHAPRNVVFAQQRSNQCHAGRVGEQDDHVSVIACVDKIRENRSKTQHPAKVPVGKRFTLANASLRVHIIIRAGHVEPCVRQVQVRKICPALLHGGQVPLAEMTLGQTFLERDRHAERLRRGRRCLDAPQVRAAENSHAARRQQRRERLDHLLEVPARVSRLCRNGVEQGTVCGTALGTVRFIDREKGTKNSLARGPAR